MMTRNMYNSIKQKKQKLEDDDNYGDEEEAQILKMNLLIT